MKNEKENVNMENIDIQQINDSHKAVILTFNSYEKELVDFLVEDALDNQNKKISITYLWFYKTNKELCGYVTVLADAINL